MCLVASRAFDRKLQERLCRDKDATKNVEVSMSTTGQSAVQTAGRVKWFSAVKGYGFIQVDGIEQDVFVHFSQIHMEGYKTLHDDHAVMLAVEWSDKGPIALSVRLAEAATPALPHAA
jgi:CspA family cold shock protein